MIIVKLYGQPTSTYSFVKSMMEKQASDAQIDLKIEEIHDWDRIMEENVLSIPTVRVNGHINHRLKEGEDVNNFIQIVNASILKEENFGTMNKILVPIDFSSASQNAVIYAYKLANQNNSVIRLTHCYRPSMTTIDGTVIVSNMSEAQARQELSNFRTALISSSTLEENQPLIDESFKIGFATQEIIAESEEHNNDLIVIGSTGSNESKKMWGSISTDIALQAKRPVIIVPKNSTFTGIKKLMYAASEFDIDKNSIDKLAEIVKPFKTNIDVVHVHNGGDSPFSDEYIDMWTEAFPNHVINFNTLSGENIAETISNFAVDNKTDLLALTKSKQSFFQSLFHSSVTKSLALTTDIPIVVLHED